MSLENRLEELSKKIDALTTVIAAATAVTMEGMQPTTLKVEAAAMPIPLPPSAGSPVPPTTTTSDTTPPPPPPAPEAATPPPPPEEVEVPKVSTKGMGRKISKARAEEVNGKLIETVKNLGDKGPVMELLQSYGVAQVTELKTKQADELLEKLETL